MKAPDTAPVRLLLRATCLLALLGAPAWAADPPVGGGGSKAAATSADPDTLLDALASEVASQPASSPAVGPEVGDEGDEGEASEEEADTGRDALSSGDPTAWRRMAFLLEKEDLPYSALVAWSHALQAEPQGVAGEVERILDLAEQLGDEALIAPGLVEVLDAADLEPALAGRAAVVAGRDLLRRSHLGAARDVLEGVDRDTPSFPDAQMLLGIVIANQGRPADGLPALLTAESTARKANREADFQTATKLNVARAFYGAGQWEQAVAYFAKVERGSAWWPDAQFERAWAHFRADDMQSTLALLKNHDSPFFNAWYYPEADLLRAYALFSLCKFPSVTAEIDAFMARYQPMKADLDRTLGALGPAAALDDVRALRQGETTQLPAAVIRAFRTDQRLTETLTAVDALDAELSALEGRGDRPWTRQAKGWLTERREARVQAEGQRVLDRASQAATELAEMLQGIELTRVDMLGMETEMYERAAATGKLELPDPAEKLRKARKARKGQRIWPFQGEYWADELGWFAVDAQSDCPPSLSDGE